MKRIPASRRVRILSKEVSFFSTVGQIRQGVGTTASFNDACLQALERLEEAETSSVGGYFCNVPVQLDLWDAANSSVSKHIVSRSLIISG